MFHSFHIQENSHHIDLFRLSWRKGINQAIGASRLGHRVTLIGNVGSDLDSDNIYRALNENGVETHGVKRCLQTDTGKAYIFVDSNGDSMIQFSQGKRNFHSSGYLRERTFI